MQEDVVVHQPFQHEPVLIPLSLLALHQITHADHRDHQAVRELALCPAPPQRVEAIAPPQARKHVYA